MRCSVWGGSYSFVGEDPLNTVETRDEPQRTSALEATSTRILFESKIYGLFYQLFNDFRLSFFPFYYHDISIILLKKVSWKFWYKDKIPQRISQWKYGYSMSSIFRPDPTRRVAKFIHGNHCPYPILETPKKKSFESKKSTLIYFRWIFLVFSQNCMNISPPLTTNSRSLI